MNYVVDTWRWHAWQRTQPAPIAVAAGGANEYTLTADDIVFAHAPTDFDHWLDQSAHPVHTDDLRRIKAFRQAMIDAALDGRAPMLVLYSGESVTDTEAEEWRRSVHAVALPGFPAHRIRIFPRPVDRRSISHTFLQHLVETYENERARTVGTAPVAGDRGAGATAIVVEQEKSVDATFALRLLCEAWQLTGGRKGAVTGDGLCIHAPITAADWFRPFGIETPSVEEASRIAELMSEGKEEARALLVSLIQERELSIGSGVAAFLDALGRPVPMR